MCLDIRNAMHQGVVEPAEVLHAAVTLDVTARRAESIDVNPETLGVVEALLDAACPAIGAACQIPVQGREGAGFLRYEPGGFYRRHRDRGSAADWPGAARRLISVVVFLNNSSSEPAPGTFGGGELLVCSEPPGGAGTMAPVTIVPRQGTLVAFDASTPHEVCPVHWGTRDVIVDWYY